MPSIWTIVLAAGSGARYGAAKQYETLEGRRVLDWSLAAAREVSDGVVLVVSSERAGDPEPGADVVVAGGATRAASVSAGLAAVPGDAGVIVVHDAARPMATTELFTAVVERVRSGAPAAVPAMAVTDTIKRVRDGVVAETLDRGELVAVQTPQAFRADALRAAHLDGDLDATDDAAMVEQAGFAVAIVPGETANVKITHASDLDRLRGLR